MDILLVLVLSRAVWSVIGFLSGLIFAAWWFT